MADESTDEEFKILQTRTRTYLKIESGDLVALSSIPHVTRELIINIS